MSAQPQCQTVLWRLFPIGNGTVVQKGRLDATPLSLSIHDVRLTSHLNSRLPTRILNLSRLSHYAVVDLAVLHHHGRSAALHPPPCGL